MTARVIRFYAVALRTDGKIGQLLVTREMIGAECVRRSQEWTGVTYRSNAEAVKALVALNCSGSK